MIRSVSTGVTILAALLVQTSAQLLSCSDIHCPLSYGTANCNIEDATLTMLGVSNFSSSLSPNPLTWTIGYIPPATTNDTDRRRYFLGTPQGLNLNARTDITGCALFFTGIEASLRFNPGGSGLSLGFLSGTCADALGSTCVSDLTNQAYDVVANSTTLGNLQCSDIAQALQSSPPGSCIDEGTWGNITAKTITGSDGPAVLQVDDCNPTVNTTYDVRNVATFRNNFDPSYVLSVTPLMTIFAATGDASNVMSSPEVNLQCMKPIEDLPPNETMPQGKGEALVVKKSWPAMLVALTGFLATAIFMN